MLKYLFIVVFSCFILTMLWISYNQGHLEGIIKRPMDKVSFANIKDKCGVLDMDLVYTTSLKKISDCLNKLSAGIEYAGHPMIDYQSNPDFVPYIASQDPTKLIIGTDAKIDWVKPECLYNNPFSLSSKPYFCDHSAIVDIEHGPESNTWFIFKKHSQWIFHNGQIMEDVWLKPIAIYNDRIDGTR